MSGLENTDHLSVPKVIKLGTKYIYYVNWSPVTKKLKTENHLTF